jgi:hypothetical protein
MFAVITIAVTTVLPVLLDVVGNSDKGIIIIIVTEESS